LHYLLGDWSALNAAQLTREAEEHAERERVRSPPHISSELSSALPSAAVPCHFGVKPRGPVILSGADIDLM
jgi:hypothetical protein